MWICLITELCLKKKKTEIWKRKSYLHCLLFVVGVLLFGVVIDLDAGSVVYPSPTLVSYALSCDHEKLDSQEEGERLLDRLSCYKRHTPPLGQ
jgi:hypothetical protein